MFCVVLFSFSSETLRQGWQQPEAIRHPFKCQRWIHCSGGWLKPMKTVQHPLLRYRPSTCIISSDMLYYIIDCFEWWTVDWITLLLCRIVHGIHVAVFHLGFLGDYTALYQPWLHYQARIRGTTITWNTFGGVETAQRAQLLWCQNVNCFSSNTMRNILLVYNLLCFYRCSGTYSIYNISSPDGQHYIPPTDENYPKSIAESKCPHLGGPWPKRSLGGLLLWRRMCVRTFIQHKICRWVFSSSHLSWWAGIPSMCWWYASSVINVLFHKEYTELFCRRWLCDQIQTLQLLFDSGSHLGCMFCH